MSFVSALQQLESGGRNIPNTTQGTSSGQAQGYFQITTGTWTEFAPRIGVDTSQYPTALSAPYSTQAQVASIIPMGRWAPETLSGLQAQGYTIDPRATLGQNALNNGDNSLTNLNATGGDYLTAADPTSSNYGDITNYQVAGVNAPLGSYGDALGPNGADVAPDITNDPTIIGDQSTNPDFGAGSSGVPDTGTFDWSTLDNANNPIQSQIPIQPQSSQGQYIQPIGGAEWISNASDIGQVAGQNISTAADTLSKQLGSSTTTLAQTAGTVESSSFSGITDFLVRGGFIAVGLVVLIGAFAFYFVENKPNIARALT